MKLGRVGTNVHHVSGGLQGQRSKVKVTARSNDFCGGGVHSDSAASRLTCLIKLANC